NHRIDMHPQRWDGPEPIESYPTQDKDKRRDDYGLIQRYTLGHLVVVTCAGSSSLGTFAAVNWAIDEKVGATPTAGEILLPEDPHPDGHLEVLIRVSAGWTDCPSAWHPDRVELVKVLLDDREYKKSGWQPRTPVLVTLRHGPEDA